MSVASYRRLVGSLACVVALALPVAFGSPQDQDKPKPEAPKKPALYNPKADAREQITAATFAARRDHSRVLVMFGFETCGWCHKLDGLFASNAQIHKVLRDEYVRVQVEYRAPHADELMKECKAALSEDEAKKTIGYPFLAVLDGDGKVVTAQRTDPLEEGDHHDPEKVKEFLSKWVAPQTDARKALEGALARAAADDKRIFLHFGAPWCGWCHRLEDFMARPEMAAIFARDFIDAKIDEDRMANAKDLEATFRKNASGGIPWYAILDAQGNVIVTSDGPKGNIGYPGEPQEIDHFMTMLRKTVKRIEPGQLDQIEAALRKAGAELHPGL